MAMWMRRTRGGDKEDEPGEHDHSPGRHLYGTKENTWLNSKYPVNK